MKLLTKSEILEILIYAKEIYNQGDYYGMCGCIEASMKKLTGICDLNYIPEFNYISALNLFGAVYGSNNGYWWLTTETNQRNKYFDYLIKLYK